MAAFLIGKSSTWTLSWTDAPRSDRNGAERVTDPKGDDTSKAAAPRAALRRSNLTPPSRAESLYFRAPARPHDYCGACRYDDAFEHYERSATSR
jgi:hypothetical protein